MAAKGYPGDYEKGSVIRGLNEAGAIEGVTVFHAGTKAGANGEVQAHGGRVLNVSAVGRDVAEARSRAYAAVGKIDWPGGFCRSDIGLRAFGSQRAARERKNRARAGRRRGSRARPHRHSGSLRRGGREARDDRGDEYRRADWRSLCLRNASRRDPALLRSGFRQTKRDHPPRLFSLAGPRVWDIWRPWAPALFRSERIFELVLPPGLPKTFDGLKIPFMSVATDFSHRANMSARRVRCCPRLQPVPHCLRCLRR